MPLALLIVPVFATLLGGLVAVRFRRWLDLLLAFGAGLLLAAAFLDLLPEAVTIGLAAGAPVTRPLLLTLLAFLAFFVLQVGLNSISNGPNARLSRKYAGRVAGGLLIFHSFRDGLAIGAAYSASHAAGYAVAVGIAAHDLGDGLNTVLLTTGGSRPTRVDYAFLVADALAPFAGGLAALSWMTSSAHSMALLAVAAGFFMHMAMSDFLPEARKCALPQRYLVLCVLAGAAFIYAANLLLEHVR